MGTSQNSTESGHTETIGPVPSKLDFCFTFDSHPLWSSASDSWSHVQSEQMHSASLHSSLTADQIELSHVAFIKSAHEKPCSKHNYHQTCAMPRFLGNHSNTGYSQQLRHSLSGGIIKSGCSSASAISTALTLRQPGCRKYHPSRPCLSCTCLSHYDVLASTRLVPTRHTIVSYANSEPLR